MHPNATARASAQKSFLLRSDVTSLPPLLQCWRRPRKMTKKQQDEVEWVHRLKRLLPDFPQGEIVPNACEPPDVFVKGNDRTLGIEVSRLFRPSAPSECQELQARESNIRKIVDLAHEMHLKAGLPDARVFVVVNNQWIASNEVKPLARALADIVRRNLPADGARSEEDYTWDNRSYFPEKIDKVMISRLFPCDTTWHGQEAAWGGGCDAVQVQGRIDAKSVRHDHVRKQCDESWLLLVTDSTSGLASHLQLTPDAQAHCYATPFERVFVTESFFTRLHELRRIV